MNLKENFMTRRIMLPARHCFHCRTFLPQFQRFLHEWLVSKGDTLEMVDKW